MKRMIPTTIGASLSYLACMSLLQAGAPAYKADQTIGDKELKAAPVSIAIDRKDSLYVLTTDGTVAMYGADGKASGQFKSTMSPEPSSMAVMDGKIYLFNTKRAVKEIEYHGKKVKKMVSEGIGAEVYDEKGSKVGELNLPEAKSAADAHFIGNELAIGDLEKSQIVFYQLDGKEGKVTKKIAKGFRLCCGIFDFAPGVTPGTIMVANLGAFKVQTFTGETMTSEFGQRGEKPEEFHGCCNPVNVAALADGSIISVEKSPTRVKIFDKDGKTSTPITGLSELVQGCSTIPVAVDSKGSIYLASDTKKCVIKCVPGVSDKPEPEVKKDEGESVEVEAHEMSPAMKEIVDQVTPMMEAKEFAKASEKVKELVGKSTTLKEEEKVQLMVGVAVAPAFEKGDLEGALKAMDEIAKDYPNSEFVKELPKVKEELKATMEMIQQLKESAKSGMLEGADGAEGGETEDK